MKIDSSTATTTRTDHVVSLTKDDILEFLRSKGVLEKGVPDRAVEITAHVPGGGDWSNTDLVLGSESLYSLHVAWSA